MKAYFFFCSQPNHFDSLAVLMVNIFTWAEEITDIQLSTLLMCGDADGIIPHMRLRSLNYLAASVGLTFGEAFICQMCDSPYYRVPYISIFTHRLSWPMRLRIFESSIRKSKY